MLDGRGTGDALIEGVSDLGEIRSTGIWAMGTRQPGAVDNFAWWRMGRLRSLPLWGVVCGNDAMGTPACTSPL